MDHKMSFGSYGILDSKGDLKRELTEIHKLNESFKDQSFWIRGRIHTSRAKGKQLFLVLRQQIYTIQCIAFLGKNSVTKEMIKYISQTPRESIVDIKGKVKSVPAPIEACTQKNIELDIEEFYIVSQSESVLPLQIEDACRSEAEAQSEDGLSIRVNQDTRLGMQIILEHLY